jgi:UDP-N-acetylmuramate: L-alanyl-gamma-D-glutamyl-meso-diaminopimelate ligase
MHIHILGICGTFMGGIALLARELGFEVSGSDSNVYPPMSTQLESAGIELMALDDLSQFKRAPDLTVIGNALSRGNPAVEYVLNENLAYISGPAFLADYLLKERWVLGVAGTHGKTSTASLLAWILEHGGLTPGFLIGGIPQNFGLSARSGNMPFFVVEADEYDSAFFDKRSKFVHYRPRTLILNNLEFDHADIFENLDAIKRQFHHLLRTVPGNGLIVKPDDDANLQDVIEMGCWTPVQNISFTDSHADWHIEDYDEASNTFNVWTGEQDHGRVQWTLLGKHNVSNAVTALAAARHAGVPVELGIEALGQFKNVKRRMEHLAEIDGITVYDDFAHHPTAIETTLNGLRKRVGDARIIAVLEPRSNTMRMGVHRDQLANSYNQADVCYLYQPEGLDWNLADVAANASTESIVFSRIEDIIEKVCEVSKSGDNVLIMSNGGFGGIHQKLIAALKSR